MKYTYLENLKNELHSKGIYDNDEIIKKYERRYNLGKEAGLSDEEIEEMLGSPQSVAARIYVENHAEEEITKEAEDSSYNDAIYNVDISTVADDIYILFDDIDKVQYENQDADLYNYEIINNENYFRFVFKKSRFLALYRNSGKIKILLPRRLMDNFRVYSTDGSVRIIGEVKAKRFSLETITGRVEIEKIDTLHCNIKTVSGTASCNKITGDDIIVGTVSGNIGVEYIKSNELRLESVSGSIIINEASASIKASTVAGNLMVNGNEIGTNIKNKVRSFFR